MECLEGEEIEIHSSFYGRKSLDKCSSGNGNPWHYSNYLICHKTFDTTAKLKENCDGKSTCEYEILGGRNYVKFWSDYKSHCPRIRKYHEIKYSCNRKFHANHYTLIQ